MAEVMTTIKAQQSTAAIQQENAESLRSQIKMDAQLRQDSRNTLTSVVTQLRDVSSELSHQATVSLSTCILCSLKN